ncbi:MAG TPA: hypothetical protein VIM03_03730 [Thermoleophilaceae bacterium]
MSHERDRGVEHQAAVIVPWGDGDLPLLERLLGDPAMMEHLGGPEPPDQIRQRQLRYADPASGCFKVVERGAGPRRRARRALVSMRARVPVGRECPIEWALPQAGV